MPQLNKIVIQLRKIVFRTDFILFLALSGLFIALPQLDLWFSHLHFTQEDGFFLRDLPVVKFVDQEVNYLHLIIAPVLLIALVFTILQYRSVAHLRARQYLMLILSLLLGPGLLVNIVLKNNSFGRERPYQVAEFGGNDQFTAAYQFTDQCQTNCSFVSGHASIGFFFIGLAWLLQSRWAFVFGVLIGTGIGYIRIIHGKHFLSDVIFAFWAVYFVNLLLAKLLQLPQPWSHRQR